MIEVTHLPILLSLPLSLSLSLSPLPLQVAGKAVGFLSVSTELDVDLLNTCYQLEPFHGLRHPSDADEALSEGACEFSVSHLVLRSVH